MIWLIAFVSLLLMIYSPRFRRVAFVAFWIAGAVAVFFISVLIFSR